MGTIPPIASCRLLGPFILSRDGVEVVLPRKAQALLTLLALQEDAPIAREIVADMLWTASGPEQARLSLRQCLWSIGRRVRCDLVRAERQLLRLAENVAVDARDFRSLAASQARPDMSRAADLYRGELLATLATVSPRFDEWLTVERQRLRGLAAGVLRRLAESQVAAGEFDAAVAAGRQLVALDDLNEDAHRLLMRILGQAGRRAEGVRQFETCRQTLRRELNIEPDAETWTLAQSLREGPRVGSAFLAPQESGPAPSAPVQQPVERRPVTVMSCKLDGLADLASEVEPEELKTEIAFFRDRCREYVSRFGGVISRVAGDGCLAVFGYPQAHEYDSESAVRAGLAIVEAVRRTGGCDGRLHTRTGIATGLAVVGDLTGEGTGEPYSVVGETANLASRLEALANSDVVVIAAGTRSLLGDLFEYRDLGAIELRGLTDAVPVWQVLCPSAIPSRFAALHGSALTRLLGRDEEIDFLLRRWTRAKAGNGQVILISGEPGIGKSHLAAGFAEHLRAEPHLRLCYFCSPYHQDSALYPFIEQLGRASGFAREDPPVTRLEKLGGSLARAALPHEDVALLADLISLPASEHHPLPNLSPQRKKERTLEALIRLLEGLAHQKSVVTVFEDAQWLDPTSRELLDLVVEQVRSLPVLLIVTFRPEFQPPWAGQPHVSMLALNRLDQRDRTALVAQIAGSKTLPDEVVSQIAERTDGVPLFVEELTKSVLERGLLREENDRYVLDRPMQPLAIPMTLHASLLARLDRLGSVRHVAQTGAAIGRQFSYPVLRAVSRLPENELRAALAQLVASELVFQRGTPPDSFYRFKHALVQDAAHGSLFRNARQQLHARIAEALETDSPEIMESQPELLAQHYAEARLVEKSVTYWGKAGRRSVARSALAEAAVQFQKGLDQLALLANTAECQQLKLEYYSAMGAALRAAKGFAAPETGNAYTEARNLWEQLQSPAEFLQIPFGLSRYHSARGELNLSMRLDQGLLHLSRKRNDTAGLVLAHLSSGRNLMHAGMFAEARSHLEEVLAHYDPASHRSLVRQVGLHPHVNAQDFLGIVRFCLGFPDRALALSNAAVAEARRLAHPPTLAGSLAISVRLLSLVGDDAALDRQTKQLLDVATEQGFPLWRALGAIFRGWVKIKKGDVTEGISLLRGGSTAYRVTGAELAMAYYTTLLARGCEILGQVEESLALLDDALQIVERTGEHWFAAELYRHKGQLQLRHGYAEAAEELYRKALSIAREQEAKLWELRAAVSLAGLWREQGRRAEAGALLAPVYGWFTEGFATPDLKAAKMLLDELE